MTRDMKSDSPAPSSGNTGGVRRKIRSIPELATIAEESRKAGRTVVLCHGVFDLLHMGHVRHLEIARREGDVLIITVTADRFVHKGPGRPIFPEHLRAEMLASLEYVDFVGVNSEPSAEALLASLRPDVYVKGSDYENPEDDVTGGIGREKAAVENHGGRLLITKDITFSSSSLINRYLDIYDPPLRDYLDDFRNRTALDDLLALIESVKAYRVLLVGDAIVDEYRYVDPLGKSAKENIIATRFKGSELFAGGVFAAANHVAGFCRDVEIVTVLGTAESHEETIRGNLKPNVRLSPLYRESAPTTVKSRFVDVSYLRKLFEVYAIDDTPLDPTLEAKLIAIIRDRAPAFDLVIVTDFGHGMITRPVIAALNDHARFLAVNAQSNAGNQGFNLVTKYPRADYVCIDGNEARLAVTDKYADLAVIAAEALPRSICCPRLIITGGHHGCITFDQNAGVARIPAFTKTIVDTVGAGDALLAVTAPLVAAGGGMEQIGFIGNAAGALKVGIVGHRSSVEKIPLIKFINTLMK